MTHSAVDEPFATDSSTWQGERLVESRQKRAGWAVEEDDEAAAVDEMRDGIPFTFPATSTSEVTIEGGTGGPSGSQSGCSPRGWHADQELDITFEPEVTTRDAALLCLVILNRLREGSPL